MDIKEIAIREVFMKKNVLLFSHQLKVGGAPTVLCEMGKILKTPISTVAGSKST